MGPKLYGAAFLLLLGVSLALPTFPQALAQQVEGSGPYREALAIYVIGDDAFFSLELKGKGIGLEALELAEGKGEEIEGYKLILGKAIDWWPEFTLLGDVWLSVLEEEPIPSSGALLVVNSPSLEAAEVFAKTLGEGLGLHFSPLELDPLTPLIDGGWVYYSHANFDALVSELIWPEGLEPLGGLSKALTLDRFLATKLTTLVMEGMAGREGFEREWRLLGLRQGLVEEKLELRRLLPGLEEAMPSPQATSSSITIIMVGSLIASVEPEVPFTNEPQNFTASLRMELEQGEAIPELVLEPMRNLPSLVVVREVDKASLEEGEEVEVSVSIRNNSPEGAPVINNVSIFEDWWRGAFELVGGRASAIFETLQAGETKVLRYRLRALEGSGGSLLGLDDGEEKGVRYTFTLGNGTLQGEALPNQLPMGIGIRGSYLLITANTNASLVELGEGIKVRLRVENLGDEPAVSVRVIGSDGEIIKEAEALGPGEVLLVEDEVVKGLSARERVRWSVEWIDAATGSERKASSNSLDLVSPVIEPKLPAIIIGKLLKVEGDRIEVSLQLLNRGRVRAQDISVMDLLPKGLRFLEGGRVELEGQKVLAEGLELDPGENVTLTYTLEVAERDNLFIPPALALLKGGGLLQLKLSNTTALPLGLRIEKEVVPNPSMVTAEGMVIIRAINQGTSPLYDLNLEGGTDEFLRVKANATAIKAEVLAGGEERTLNYLVSFERAGNFTVAPARAKVRLAWEEKIIESSPLSLTIYPLPEVKLAVPSAPMEGRPFQVTITLSNDSPLELRQLTLKMELPPPLSPKEGKEDQNLIEVELAELGPHSTKVLNLELVANRPTSVELPNPILNFSSLGQRLSSEGPRIEVAIMEDMVGRYALPLALASVALIGIAVYLRKLLTPS